MIATIPGRETSANDGLMLMGKLFIQDIIQITEIQISTLMFPTITIGMIMIKGIERNAINAYHLMINTKRLKR